MATSQLVSPPNCHQEIVRPPANFSPSLWGDHFSSFTFDNEALEKYAETIEVLKEEVKTMLKSSNETWVEKLNLIDTLQRLGVSYHFETEIKEQMEKISNAFSNSGDDNEEDYDLHTVALHFRLSRQYGYNLSCGIFKKFKDNSGKFKEALANDPRGLLSLYEAAHVRIHGEDILEEALAFATDNLRAAVTNDITNPSNLAKQVAHTLEQSLQRGMPRLEVWHYISIYKEDESRNKLLLRLATLDFNMLQMLHKHELCELSKWWKELNLVGKLPYARDRLVECYFWALGVYFEPQYSQARIMLAKTIAMISVIDDTFDSYGTIEELTLFDDAVQRWDYGCLDQLPNYMKALYEVLLKLYDDFDSELANQGRSYAVDHAKNTMKEIVRAYYIEAKWFIEGYTPPFDEYLNNALVTSTYYLLSTSSFLGMKEAATTGVFDWLLEKPKMLQGAVTICRLVDDVATYKIEKERGQAATGIECYMKQYGVSKEEAMEECMRRAESGWIDMNEQYINPTSVPKEIFMRVLNLARMIDVAYKHFEDGYTNPEKLFKKYITGLVVDPLPI